MPFEASAIWTLEAIAILKDGYGYKSATVLANEIGCSKNAVVGKAFRLGLTAKKKRGWMPVLRAPRAPRAELVRTAMPAPKSNRQPPQVLPINCWSPLPGCPPVSIYRLQNNQCRWPVDGGFCGCEKEVPDRPYCVVHRQIASGGWHSVRNSQPSAESPALTSAPSPVPLAR